MHLAQFDVSYDVIDAQNPQSSPAAARRVSRQKRPL